MLKHAMEQTRARALAFGAECAEHIATLAAADRPGIVFESAHPDVNGGGSNGLLPAPSLEAGGEPGESGSQHARRAHLW